MKLPITLSFALAATLHAGSINLVNLLARDTTRFAFNQGDSAETIELRTGSFSGKFLSNVDTSIRCIEVPDSKTTITPDQGHVIVIFHQTEEKPQWRVIPSKPTENQLSLRILNLGTDAVTVHLGDEELRIDADAIHEVESPQGRRLTLSIPDSELRETFDPAEPSAGLAILTHKDGSWQITIIPDI